MKITGRLLAVVFLAYAVIYEAFCQVSTESQELTNLRPNRNYGSSRHRRPWRVNPERIIRRYEKEVSTLKSQMLSLEYRLSSSISATINERLADIVLQAKSQGSQLHQIADRLGNVEGELQTLQDQPRIVEDTWSKDSNVNGFASRIKSLEESVRILGPAAHNSTEYPDIQKYSQSEICTRCEESVENLRREVYGNISKVLGSHSRSIRKNHGKSKRSSPEGAEIPYDYDHNVVEYDVIGVDLYDDYLDEENSTETDYQPTEELNGIERNQTKSEGESETVSIPHETKPDLDGIGARLLSHENLMANLLEMHTNNSLILDGFENRFNTIITAFSRADKKDTDLGSGIRSNRRMLEAFAKSLREVVQDSRRQNSAIVNLRKRIRNLEGTSPKSFARNADVQSLRKYVNRTLTRLGRKEARTEQGTTLSKKSIKSIVKSAMSSINESVVHNREAIDQIRNLPRTVSLLESQLASYSSEVQAIPQLRNDIAGIVTMKNLVLRNSADITKIHHSITTGEVSLIEFYSKLDSLDKTVQNLQIIASDLEIDNSALHSDIRKLNSSALDAAYGLSYFKNVVGYNISQVMYSVQDLSSAIITTNTEVKYVDSKISNLERDFDNQGTAFEVYKAGINASFHEVDNRLSQIDRSIIQANDMISNSNTKFVEEVESLKRRIEESKDLIGDLTGDVGDLRSTLDRTREEDFRATTERNEIGSRMDVLTADVRDQAMSVATLQSQVGDSGSTLITMDSRINSLESVATRFGDFEESTNRRFRTELNVTREVRQKILEQFSRLESIDTQMNELVNSVHIAQSNIMAQRNDFKSLFDRSANQSQSLRRLAQRLQNDFTGSNVTRELYRKINELHRTIGSVKSEINAFSAKETAQKARFEDIENDVSGLQTSGWEHSNKNTEQDNLLKNLRSQLDQTKEKGRLMEESLSTTGSQLQQFKQVSDRNSEDLSEMKTWRDDMDYAVYFLDKFTTNLINNSREATIANRRLSARVLQLESQGQSFALQVDTVKRIVDSNAAGLAQQYSQVNGLIRKDSELDLSLERVKQKLTGIDTLRVDLSDVADRTTGLSQSVSRHKTRIANLGTKSNYIYDEVNATTYRLNEMMSDFHDENRKRYARETALVSSIRDAQRSISRVNTSISYTRASLLSLTADLSMKRQLIDNVSSDVDQMRSIMVTGEDLRDLKVQLQKRLSNISLDVDENLQSVEALSHKLNQASEEFQSAREQDIVRDLMLENLSTSLQAQNVSINDIAKWKNYVTAELADMLLHQEALASNLSVFRHDTLNTTRNWIMSLEEKISELHHNAQATSRKIDAGNANISVLLNDVESRTQVSISAMENNLTRLQHGADRMLSGELGPLRVNQQNLSRAVFSSELLIDKLQDELDSLKQWQSVKLKKSSLAQHFQLEIMKKMAGQLGSKGETQFIERHIPDDYDVDDVDESTWVLVGMAMLAIDQDTLLTNLSGEIEENRIEIITDRMQIRHNFSAVQQDVTNLSKDMIRVSERFDDTSMHVEKSLTKYLELSSVTRAVQNMVSLTHSKVVNLSSRTEQIHNISKSILKLKKSVENLEAKNRLEFARISSLLTSASNLTEQQMMDVMSESLNSLNASVQRKLSDLEAINVRKQLDVKIEGLNSTVRVLSRSLEDFNDQFASIADHVPPMRFNSTELPVGNAILCEKSMPFLHLCRKKYVAALKREVEYVRYGDLFQYLYEETQRLKYIPQHINSVTEMKETISKEKQYFELVVQQYVEELNSSLWNVSRESRETTDRLRVIEAVHSDRLDIVEHQSVMTQNTVNNIASNVSSLCTTVSPLSGMPKAVADLEREVAHNVEIFKSALNGSISSNQNNLVYFNGRLKESSNKVLSQSKDMYVNLQSKVTSQLSSIEDKQSMNYGFLDSKVSSQEADIENLFNFRVDLVKVLKDIRNTFLPLIVNEDSQASDVGSGSGVDSTVDSVVQHFVDTLQGHINGTQDTLANMKTAFERMSNRIVYQDKELDKINAVETELNTSLIAHEKSIIDLMDHTEVEANWTKAMLESAFSYLNATNQDMADMILADRHHIDSLQNELDVEFKYFNESISWAFARIETVESDAVRSDVAVRSLLAEACNESAPNSNAIERRLTMEVARFQEDLDKISENGKSNSKLLQETALSLTSINLTVEEMQNTVEQRVVDMLDTMQDNSVKIVALSHSARNASVKQHNILSKLDEMGEIVESLQVKGVSHDNTLRNVNKSLESLMSADQLHTSSIHNISDSVLLDRSQMAEAFHKIDSINQEIAEHRSAISTLQNQSTYQNGQIRAHEVEIELLQTLEKQSSEYTDAMLSMISAIRFTNGSKLKSATLSESDNKAMEAEIQADKSIGGIEACTNQISVLAERLDGINGHFKNRLQQFETTTNAVQEKMFNQIHTLEISVQSLEDTSSSINAKMLDTSQYLHSVMMQVNDGYVRLENTSAVLRVNISRCESMLRNLSAITKETDMKLNLRDISMAKLGNVIEVLAINNSRKTRVIEDMQNFLQALSAHQTSIQYDVSYINDSCSDLSKSIDANHQWHQLMFSESQMSFNKGLSKIGKDTTQLKDTMTQNQKKIQKLEVQHLNLRKRQSDVINFEQDLEQRHINLSSYVIKSQAQNGEKFLMLLGMTSKISNVTDTNKANVERLHDVVGANKKMLDSIKANVNVFGRNISNLIGITASGEERMKHLSASIDVLKLNLKQLNSSTVLVIEENFSKDHAIEQNMILLNESVVKMKEGLYDCQTSLRNMTVHDMKSQMILKERFDNLEAFDGLRRDELKLQAGMLERLLNRTDVLSQNQMENSETIIKNSAEISTVVGEQSQIRMKINELQNSTANNLARIQSLWTVTSMMEDDIKTLNSTSQKISETTSGANFMMSSELDIIKSSIFATNQDLDLQSEQISNISAKVDDFVKTSANIVANLSDKNIIIDKIVRDLHGAYEIVENQGNILVSLDSSYQLISDAVKVLSQNQDDFRANQSLMLIELESNQIQIQNVKSLERMATENFHRLNNSIQQNWKSILSFEERTNKENSVIDEFRNKSTSWDTASEKIKFAIEELRLVRKDAQDQETHLRLHDSKFGDIFNSLETSKNSHRQLRRVIQDLKQEIDSLRNSSVYYKSNNEQESSLRAQSEETARMQMKIVLMQEKLRNLTRDEIDFEDEIKNTTNALRVLAARISNQSIALRLIGDENEIRGNLLQERLDNMSVSLMQTDAENADRFNHVWLLASKYNILFDEVWNNTKEIVNNKMRDTEMISRILKLDGFTADIRHNLSGVDKRLTEFEMKMKNRTDGLAQLVQDARRNMSISTENMDNLFRISVKTNADDIQNLRNTTNELVALQDGIGLKISNLTQQFKNNVFSVTAKNLLQDQEAEMLKSSLENVIESMVLVRNLSNNLSWRVEEISTDLVDTAFEIQNNVSDALHVLESWLSDDIASNKNRIDLLSASMKVRGKVDTSLRIFLDNLTNTLEADIADRRQNIAGICNATQSLKQMIERRFSAIDQQIQSNLRNFGYLNDRSSDLSVKQQVILNGLTNETERIALLGEAMRYASLQIWQNTRNLRGVDNRLARLDMTMSGRLNNHSISIKLLRDFDETSNQAMSDLRSQLLAFDEMFGVFKFETEHERNVTRSAASRSLALLEKSIKQNLTDTSTQINALAEAMNRVTSNQSTNQKHIGALIGNMSSLTRDLKSLNNRQHRHEYAVRLLQSVQNETEQQVELMSDEMLRLYDRTSQCEVGLERHTASILSQDNRFENMTTFLDMTRQEVSRQGLDINRTSVDLELQQKGMSSLNETVQSLQSSDIEAQKKISTIDGMLQKAKNDFEKFVNSSCDFTLLREHSYSWLQSNLTTIKKDQTSYEERLQQYNETVSEMQRNMLQRKDQKFDSALASIHTNLTALSSVVNGKLAELDLFTAVQEGMVAKLNILGKQIFDFYGQTSSLESTAQKHTAILEEHNIQSQEIAVEMENIVKKVEYLMMLNLKNYTLVDDESLVLSFAKTLTQLRKDITALNVTAWNAISTKPRDDGLLNYDDYGQNSESAESTIYMDYPGGSVSAATDTQYLLSNFSSVLRDIENSLYFIVPKTSEVISNLTIRQRSMEVHNNYTRRQILQLQDDVARSIAARDKMGNVYQQNIKNLSAEVNGVASNLVLFKSSIANNYERLEGKIEEVKIHTLDGSRRLDGLEGRVQFVETKQRHAIEMVYEVNQTIDDLISLQKLNDGQFELMFADIESLRQNVRKAEQTALDAVETFVRISNTSTRHRISLRNEMLQTINSTAERFEMQAGDLARNGERRELLLLNYKNTVRRLSEKVAELQRMGKDAEVLVSAIAQETKWNGGQIDTCLLNLEDLQMENDRKFQNLKNEIGNHTAAIADVNSRLDSLSKTASIVPTSATSMRPPQITDQTTAVKTTEVESPTNLQTYNVDATSLLLSWDASPTLGVTGYRITLTNAFNAETPSIQQNVEDTQVIVEGLDPDTAYTVEIYAEKGNVASPALAGVAATSETLVEITTPMPESTTAVSDIMWQCNFEHSCTIYNSESDQFDWVKFNGSTPSGDTGPSSDHTLGNPNGHYVFIETSNPREPGDIARLATPAVESTQEACLEFFYHMYGVGVGDLSVWLLYRGQGKEKIWEQSGNQGDKWQKKVLELHPVERFQVMFVAVRGSDYHGDIALDDIVLKRGSCPKPLFECDFQDPNLCGFTQDTTDDFNWIRNKGATGSAFTGPTTDHTLKTPDGYYMYMETSAPQRYNQKTRLISPEILSSEKNCLHFFYHMHGLDINALNVYTTRSMRNIADKLIWNKQGPQGDAWKSASVNIAVNGRYRVVFEAIVGIDYHGDIGLDDVSISDGACDTPVCSLGQPFGGYCYVIDETPTDYVTASAACKENAGHLATAKTQPQQDFIRQLVTNNTSPSSQFWIGLDDTVTDGRFIYADGTPLVSSRSSFQAWSAGEPNGSDGDEDCVGIDIAFKRRGWSDLPCDLEIGFICQYPSLS